MGNVDILWYFTLQGIISWSDRSLSNRGIARIRLHHQDALIRHLPIGSMYWIFTYIFTIKINQMWIYHTWMVCVYTTRCMVYGCVWELWEPLCWKQTPAPTLCVCLSCLHNTARERTDQRDHVSKAWSHFELQEPMAGSFVPIGFYWMLLQHLQVWTHFLDDFWDCSLTHLFSVISFKRPAFWTLSSSARPILLYMLFNVEGFQMVSKGCQFTIP